MKWSADLSRYPAYLHNKIRKGRGMGSFDEYQPWVQKRDFGSAGNASTVQGIVIPRLHHVLSDLELIYLMMLERRPGVIDIREQWPILNIDQTLAICEEVGEHHRYEEGAPVPFTLDFLVTFDVDGERRYEAKSVKSPVDAQKPKVRKRLLVESLWCQSKNLRWDLIRTDGFYSAGKTTLITANLSFMREWFSNRYQPEEKELRQFVAVFSRYYDQGLRLDEVMRRSVQALRVSEGHADNMLRYALWRRDIKVSLSEKIGYDRPLILKK